MKILWDRCLAAVLASLNMGFIGKSEPVTIMRPAGFHSQLIPTRLHRRSCREAFALSSLRLPSNSVQARSKRGTVTTSVRRCLASDESSGEGRTMEQGPRCQRTRRPRAASNSRQATDVARIEPGDISFCTRKWALERLAKAVFGLSVARSSDGLSLTWAAETNEIFDDLDVVEYVSPDKSFSLKYPASFKAFSKPLKTHKIEVNFKSEGVKGFEIGVAVDPVKIESLEKFGTPEEVGARVLKVEQAKDGTLSTKMFDTRAEKQGDLSLYTLDYFVESTRGFKHFIAKVTIKDNLLYACTGQAKESDFSTVEGQLNRMVDSFKVPA